MHRNILGFFCLACFIANVGLTEPVRILNPELLRVGNQWVYQLHLTLDANEPVDIMAVLTDTMTGTATVEGIPSTVRDRRVNIPGIGLIIRTNHFFINSSAQWSGVRYEDDELIETVRNNNPTEFLPLVIDTTDSNRQVGSGLYHGVYKPGSGETGSYNGAENTFVTYVRTETITVPAGTFECVVVDFRLEWNDGGSGQDETRYWLDPAIGIIKAEFTEADFSEGEQSEFSIELQSTNVQTGSILVTIAPQEVIDAGAQWKIEDVPAAEDFGFMNHNVSVANIPPGTYRLSFKDVAGWTTPVPRETTLIGGNQKNENGTYTKIVDSVAPEISVAPDTITISVDGVVPSFLNGVTASDNIDGDVTDQITTSGTVDINVPNDYVITYNVSDSTGNHATAQTRTYTVVDDIAPLISVSPEAISVSIDAPAPDFLDGVTASDNVDGDVTLSIATTGTVNTSIPDDYVITYDVTDNAGNHGDTKTRTYTVLDDVSPVVVVTATTISVAIGSPAPDLLDGVTASDNVDGDVTTDITTTGTVNTSVPNDYVISYDVDDEAGNHAATATRTYSVQNQPPMINGIAGIVIPENTGTQTIILSGIIDGDEASQSLSVTASSNNHGILPDPTVTYTSDNTTGSLEITPVTDAVGSATITVTVADDGGVVNSGIDTVAAKFHVSVAPMVALPTEVLVPFSFQKGWNFFSIPMLPTDFDQETFFQGHAVGTMWTYSAEAWQQVCTSVSAANTQPCQAVELSSPEEICETICPGKSYWVYLTDDVTTVYAFSVANSLSLGAPATFRAGWNIYSVQSPTPIPTEATGSVWSFPDGQHDIFSNSQEMVPGVGYWVNLNTAVGLPIGSLLTDTDRDGIADFWEQLWGFEYDSESDQQADPDNDGLSNLEEFNAGLNPRLSDNPSAEM